MRISKALFVAQIAALAVGYGAAASALTIYLPENATYRYVNASDGTNIGAVPANWFLPGFNDSTWFSGVAPFASTGGTIINNANVGAPYAPDPAQTFPFSTFWQVNADPFLRTHFTLAAPTALTLWLAVDNGVNSMYLNGVLATGFVNDEGTANRWEHIFDIPAAYTFAGTNTLALQLEDHGVQTGFALVISANDAASNPPLTTNPAPQQPPTNDTPEPETLALLGVGLLGVAASRRRRAR